MTPDHEHEFPEQGSPSPDSQDSGQPGRITPQNAAETAVQVFSRHAHKTPRDVLTEWDVFAEVNFGEKYVLATHDYQDRFWAHLMDIPMMEISREQVLKVHITIKSLGWSPESVNKALNAFSCLSTFGIEELGWFPFVQFRFYRESTENRREQKFIRTHQIVSFLRVIASFDHLQLLLMVAMMIGLALREVEVLWACWSQFSYDDDGGLVFTALGKRGKKRRIPVPEWLEIMIRKYEDLVIDPEYRHPKRYGRPREGLRPALRPSPNGTQSGSQRDWMFPNGHGNPYSPGFTGTYIRRACKLLGILGVTPHRLRATGANVLRLEGLAIEKIQKILGHSRITTTMLYLEQSLTSAREVQNSLGAKWWPGAPSAIQALRRKVASEARPRLLPPPKEVTDQVGQQLAHIDTPAMRLLPPVEPVALTPPEPKTMGPDESVNLSEKIQELRLRNTPSRPSKSLLARLVQMMPITAIAEVFGVSDVTVGNWCDENGIEKPGRGYWARVYAATAALRRAGG